MRSEFATGTVVSSAAWTSSVGGVAALRWVPGD
jgi:hypothetical protein